jgi:hypothetical protein
MEGVNNGIRSFKTRHFAVIVTAEEETDLDLSFDEDGSIRKGLERGALVAFCAKAACYYKGLEVSTEYLGNCICESPAAFMDHRGIKRYCPPGGKPGQCGSYFSDMVHTVIREAREALEQGRQRGEWGCLTSGTD